MSEQQPPVGIDRKRHQELAGRRYHAWLRRAALLVVAVIPIVGLLNVFGQRAAITSAESPNASLTVDSPARVRGGLVFTTKIAINAHQQLQDARLYLAYGWFKGMTYNAIAPQPTSQESAGNWVVFDFGKIDAQHSFPIWISWQTNPTNVGRHSQDVQLYDGNTPLLILRRTITVFP